MLCTLFLLLSYPDDQCSEFLQSWIDFAEFPNLIKYYTSIGNSTLFKKEYNSIENCALLKDIDNLMYQTQLNFSDDTPNQILRMLSTQILWSKLNTLLSVTILPYMISWPSHKMSEFYGSIIWIIPIHV